MASDTDDIRALLRALPSLQGPYAPVDWDAFPATPQAAFVPWLKDAIASAASHEPHAMTLSTVSADGGVDARVLILKHVDARGWHFAAKADSPKGRALASSPRCALTFYWPALGRQVRVQGDAVALPADECAADFLARPLASRINAVASQQSAVLAGDTEQADACAHAQAKQLFRENPGYVSPGWVVYAVRPTAVEFWQGATDRQHGRLRYVRTGADADAEWRKERLAP